MPPKRTHHLERHQMARLGRLKLFFLHDATACGFYRAILPGVHLRIGGLAQVRLQKDAEQREAMNPFITPVVRGSAKIHKSQRAAVLDAIEWCDVVVFQRMGGEVAFEILEHAKKSGTLIVHETDDMCEKVPDWNPSYWYWRQPKVQEVYEHSFRVCDVATTTNPKLAEFYRQRFGKPVFVLPNQVDVGSARWARVKFAKGPGISVGWMGSSSHERDLDVLKPVVPWLLETFPDSRFNFTGHCPEWVKDLPPEQAERVRSQRVPGLEDVPATMADWDIALAPIIDHPFNTVGKSDVKMLEYSCAFAATIASDLSPYKETIENGSTGLFAKWNDSEDWKRKIARLIRNPGQRQQMVQNAFKYTSRNRNVAEQAVLWFRVYCDALAGKT